jgi:hypothetical protein
MNLANRRRRRAKARRKLARLGYGFIPMFRARGPSARTRQAVTPGARTDNAQIDLALAKARSELSASQAPDVFVLKVASAAVLLVSALLSGKPKANFLLDAIVLAEFAKLRPTTKVRLSTEQENWPDGFVGDPEIEVEITEVLQPGRRRGDEYRKATPRSNWGPNDPLAIAEKIPAALDEGIKKKVDKNYAGNPILLVYLNMNEFGLLQMQTEDAITSAKAKYAQHFQEICVIWRRRLY